MSEHRAEPIDPSRNLAAMAVMIRTATVLILVAAVIVWRAPVSWILALAALALLALDAAVMVQLSHRRLQLVIEANGRRAAEK